MNWRPCIKFDSEDAATETERGLPQARPAVQPARPTPAERHRRVVGASYYGYPVYYHTLLDRLYYEADFEFLVAIARSEEGQVRFTGEEPDDEMGDYCLDRLFG